MSEEVSKKTKKGANKKPTTKTGDDEVVANTKGELINFGGDVDLGEEFEKQREPNIVRKYCPQSIFNTFHNHY
jgi:hypothetical protein